jgi:ribosomal protein S18 acetylase RimI-like enzyme
MSKRVLPHVLKYIQKLGKTPFLHLYPENIPALKLYESLGFVSRTLLRVYSIEKVKS